MFEQKPREKNYSNASVQANVNVRLSLFLSPVHTLTHREKDAGHVFILHILYMFHIIKGNATIYLIFLLFWISSSENE